jgi:hypothetical protein
MDPPKEDRSSRPQVSEPVPPPAPEAPRHAARQRPITFRSEDPDLRYKFWHLLANYTNLAVAIVGFFVVWWSLQANTKSVRNNVSQNVLGLVTALDKLFVDKPYLYPYFHSNKKLEADDARRDEVLAAATMHLDVMDVVAVQSVRFPEVWEDPRAWDRWLVDQFAGSHVLREFLKAHRNWYGPNLQDKLRRAEERS